MNDGKQSTPAGELERQICSATEPKNEREWWAHREIERLRGAIEQAPHGPLCALIGGYERCSKLGNRFALFVDD
jgi:hypothetical protein